MRITVFGATGGTGKQLVRQALDAGHSVRAVVRDPARMPIDHPELSVIEAELADTEAVRSAIDGQDAVLSALAASAKQGGIATVAVRAMLRAMEAADVRRLLVVSAAPVGPLPEGESLVGRLALPLVRAVFRDVYADLRVMEEAVVGSDAEWTIVRPPRLLDKPLSGSYRRAMGGAVAGTHAISRADLAYAMLDMINDPESVRQVVGVAAAGEVS
ncbi:Putative NADH-flavin reductase [Amycolatopsis marina]|uniref:NADH-flavin reductase n=1 Tax=Amycolatopsis marina TaxID=490629 RepID=A0A1I1BKY5_9PSEU|nr:NAD(P)H-binding protein [Amycolatopsis marina]SFB50266.1 Putative NADH-flavin reductase [Amycolatopsis marina]